MFKRSRFQATGSSLDRQARQVFESLEARVVLSGSYYEWVGVESLPGYAAEYGEPDRVAGLSENGRYAWSSAASDTGDPDEPYIVVDNLVRYLRDITELQDAEIAGINSFGLVFATDTGGENAGRHFVMSIATPGARRYLDETLLQTPPDFDLADSQPWAVTDGGALLLAGPGSVRRVLWAVDGTRVERLWEGQPGATADRGLYVDSNAQNTVVGYGLDGHGGGVPMMWSPAAGVSNLRDSGYVRVGAANDDGSVLVSAEHDRALSLLRGGVAEPVEFVSNDDFGHDDTVGRPRGRSGDGVMIVRASVGAPQYAETEDRVITANGFADIRFPSGYVTELEITESGVVYGDANSGAGWFRPTSGRSFYQSPAGAPATVWIDEGTLKVYARFLDGESLSYVADGPADSGSWDGDWRRIKLTGADEETGRELVQNPRTGNGLLLIESGAAWTAIGTSAPEDGYAQERVFPAIRGLGDSVTGFFNAANRPVLAGYDRITGDLNLLYVTGLGRGETIVTSLSRSHLGARGQATPAFVSQLDSFTTPWGAMNIVGLDGAGDLHAVWWSPGLGSALWTTSNLTSLTGAPKLVGNVVASVTSWNGMQIMGTDERGHAITIWWSPGSGAWRWNDLTSITGGEPLEPGSLAGVATWWGAIELVGRTSVDEIATYWWAPASGGWTFESITLQQTGTAPRITGPVSMAVARDGSHYISGVSDGGEVVLLSWMADGSDLWMAANLTVLASL